MHSSSRFTLICFTFLAIQCFSLVTAQESTLAEPETKWDHLFDGKTMDGWEKVGKEDSHWTIADGSLVGSGTQSMLVCTKGPYKNFRYRVEAKINDGGNSGVYFRTTRKPGFMDGYEAQVDSTHKDPIRTGSLYGFCHVYKQHVKPGEWFTYEIEVRDDVTHVRQTEERIKTNPVENTTLAHFANWLDACEAADPMKCNNPPDLGAAAMAVVNLGAQSYRKGKVFFLDGEKREISTDDPGWARKWEELSASRADTRHIPGWAAGDYGSKLIDPAYMQYAGPWTDGKDPSDG
ncbi:MAG: 3-keto-disaccharide hydrolase [Aeoliella sp.]